MEIVVLNFQFLATYTNLSSILYTYYKSIKQVSIFCHTYVQIHTVQRILSPNLFLLHPTNDNRHLYLFISFTYSEKGK